jgi:hypothetical protein
MTIDMFLLILALIAMIIAVKPPPTWTINWMCLSFVFIICIWLFGGGFIHLHNP